MDAKAKLDCTFFLLGQATLLSYIKFIVSSSTFSLNSREKKMCSLLVRSKYLPITFDKERALYYNTRNKTEKFEFKLNEAMRNQLNFLLFSKFSRY